MSDFISYSNEIHAILLKIISSQMLHTKWLNTLSYLENCGARKIAKCEHPILVKEEMLKHAEEEFRHAHFFKKQLKKLMATPYANYSVYSLLGGSDSLHYLHRLELSICRYLKEECLLPLKTIKELAYLLVTYVIELRAEELYNIYDSLLKASRAKIRVRSILLEEKEHLSEMYKGIVAIDNGTLYAQKALEIEGKLCKRWLNKIADGKI